MDRAPRGKIARQQPPSTTALEDIDNGAKDVVQIMGARSRFALVAIQHGPD